MFGPGPALLYYFKFIKNKTQNYPKGLNKKKKKRKKNIYVYITDYSSQGPQKLAKN